MEEFFNIKRAKVSEVLLDGTKKRIDALEIIGVKPEYQGIYNNLKNNKTIFYEVSVRSYLRHNNSHSPVKVSGNFILNKISTRYDNKT